MEKNKKKNILFVEAESSPGDQSVSWIWQRKKNSGDGPCFKIESVSTQNVSPELAGEFIFNA